MGELIGIFFNRIASWGALIFLIAPAAVIFLAYLIYIVVKVIQELRK